MVLQQQEPKKIYVWVDEQVRHYTRYTPTSTTLLYLPLETTHTYTDQSGTSKSMSNSGTQFWTYSNIDCAYFNGSSKLTIGWNIGSGTNFTRCFRAKQAETSTGAYSLFWWNSGGIEYDIWFRSTYMSGSYMKTSGSSTSIHMSTNPLEWHMYTFVKSWSNFYWYKDSTLISSITDWYSSWTILSWTSLHQIWYADTSWAISYNWYLSEYIIDNKGWSQSDVTTQYNNMKEYFYIFN